MKDRIDQLVQQWGDRFEAFSLRERVLVSAGILVLLFLLWDSLLMNPEHARQTRIVGEMHELNERMDGISAQIDTMLAAMQDRETPRMQRRIAVIGNLLAELEKEKKSLTVEFVPPEQMAKLLRDMLGSEPGLTLISLHSMGAEPLFNEAAEDAARSATDSETLIPVARPATDADGEAGDNEAKPGIYKHGVRVEFEGDFYATLRYLQALEAMPWRFYWDSVDYQVLDYPTARVAITVHTLSLERGWIGV